MPNFPDPILLLVAVAAFGVMPFVALMVTSYAKLVIVFGLLRNALGTQQVPPNMVISAVAIVLSFYIMSPVMSDIVDRLEARDLPPVAQLKLQKMGPLMGDLKEPVREFLRKHAKEREKRFFIKSAEKIWPPARAQQLTEDDLGVLIPAFTTSELTAAFQIGFVIYLAFVVIDLVVANILLSLGMAMLSPTVISIPFKLLLFVMLDGWSQLIHGLVMTYR